MQYTFIYFFYIRLIHCSILLKSSELFVNSIYQVICVLNILKIFIIRQFTLSRQS